MTEAKKKTSVGLLSILYQAEKGMEGKAVGKWTLFISKRMTCFFY
jgi:hypothetical protein